MRQVWRAASRIVYYPRVLKRIFSFFKVVLFAVVLLLVVELVILILVEVCVCRFELLPKLFNFK